jgi:hypothetical protein
MGLDIGNVRANPTNVQLPGATTLGFAASTSATRSRVRVRYFIDESVPIAFVTPSGGTSKDVWHKSVDLTSVHKNIEKRLNLQKEPENAPDQVLVRIRIEIQEIDNTGKPVGSSFRRSRMITILRS